MTGLQHCILTALADGQPRTTRRVWATIFRWEWGLRDRPSRGGVGACLKRLATRGWVRQDFVLGSSIWRVQPAGTEALEAYNRSA